MIVDLVYKNGMWLCPVCDYRMQLQTVRDAHINCPECIHQPPCRHLGPTIRTTKINKCNKKIPIHSCKLYGDVTTDCEIPLTPCCRTCGEYTTVQA